MFDLIVDADSFRFSAHAPHGELDSESCRDGNEAQVVRPARRSRMLLGRGSKLRTFLLRFFSEKLLMEKLYLFPIGSSRGICYIQFMEGIKIMNYNAYLHCEPTSFFSNDYVIKSPQHRAVLQFQFWSESGRITCNGVVYDVVKNGMFQGNWSLMRQGLECYRAQKNSAFHRSFTITGAGQSYQLRAASVFGRAMIFSGGHDSFTITPNHVFSNKATISGQIIDFDRACFAFWLCALIWRRAKRSNS